MAATLSLYSAIGALNLAISGRRTSTAISRNKVSLEIVKVLYEYGYISHYYFSAGHVHGSTIGPKRKYYSKDNKIVIYFRYSSFTHYSFLSIKVKSRPGHKISLNLKELS